MASRYYYHATICRLRYDDCLLNLSEEFFLEPETIVGWLQKRLGFVNSMVSRKVTAAELRRSYPYFDWSGRTSNVSKEVKITPAGSSLTLL